MAQSNNQVIVPTNSKRREKVQSTEGSVNGATRRNKEKKARAKERRLSEVTERCLKSKPPQVKVDTFASDRWKALMEGPDGKLWQNAKGVVLGLNVDGKEWRQPVYPDMEPEKFLESILELVTDPKMIQVEQRFALKFGPFKALAFEKWVDKIWSLWMKTEWNPHEETLAWAKKEVYKDLKETLTSMGLDRIPALSMEEAYEKTTKSRNSGWPYCTSKWSQKQELVDYYYDNAVKLIDGEDTLSGTPHILFKRTAADGEVSKMRAVQSPPKHDAIAAKVLTDGFVRVFKENPTYVGFRGGENVSPHLGQIMKYDLLVESDFSGFDQRCQEIMPHVFDVIAALIPQRYLSYLWIVLKYYQNSELLTPIGLVSGKDGKINGLLSGDGWTSVIGTLANAIAVKYTMRRMGITDYAHLAFGDDIAIGCNEFDIAAFEGYMKELGMDANRAKQHVEDGPSAQFSFLGYYHNREDWQSNIGRFPMCRLAAGLFYKEHNMTPQTVKDETDLSEEELEKLKLAPEIIDMIAICSKLNNTRGHDDFESFVSFIREGSPHKLDTEIIAPFEKLREAIRNGRKTRNMGLNKQPVVRYLRHLEGRYEKLDLTATYDQADSQD